jgi:23S rRNA A1618 N6-methylase RlmF
MDTTVLLVSVPIITAIIGSYLTYYFTIKSKKNEAILKFKEEKYSNLLILLQGFVGETTAGDTKRKFFEEQYKSWLYCSDGVVRAINEMVQLVIDSRGKEPEPERGRRAVGSIVLEMRKDLLGKTELTTNDFRYTDVIE